MGCYRDSVRVTLFWGISSGKWQFFTAVSGQPILPIFKDQEPKNQESNILKPMKMEPRDSPETSVRKCHYSLRDRPKEHNSHLLRGGSLKSSEKRCVFCEEGT